MRKRGLPVPDEYQHFRDYTLSDGLAERTEAIATVVFISRQPAPANFYFDISSTVPMRGVVHSSALALCTPEIYV